MTDRYAAQIARLTDDLARSGIASDHAEALEMLYAALGLPAPLEFTANRSLTVAGLEGRYYARAALHPSYATPAGRDELVRMVLHGHPYDPAIEALTPANRGRLAAAVLAGWVQTHGQDVPPSTVGSAWHRHLGDTVVRVSAA